MRTRVFPLRTKNNGRPVTALVSLKKDLLGLPDADKRLKSRFCRVNLPSTMSLAELKETVLALPETERHDFVVWLNRLEQNYGDVPGEALAQLAAEIWDQDDRHAPPTHPAPRALGR